MKFSSRVQGERPSPEALMGSLCCDHPFENIWALKASFTSLTLLPRRELRCFTVLYVAMNALGIPTTRSLALISLPDIPVARERRGGASIVSRVAPSFIRIGSFEAHNPPDSTVVYMFGPDMSTQAGPNWEGLRILGEWVVRRVLRIERKGDEPWGLKLVKESARRNALMVAGWQAYGFMVRAPFQVNRLTLNAKSFGIARRNEYRQYLRCRFNS